MSCFCFFIDFYINASIRKQSILFHFLISMKISINQNRIQFFFVIHHKFIRSNNLIFFNATMIFNKLFKLSIVKSSFV